MENSAEGNPVEPIDLNVFKEHTRQSLLNILDKLPKVEKTLILEKACISKLNFITTLEPLKEKLVKKELGILDPDKFYTTTPLVIYMISSSLSNVKIIEKHIKENIKEKKEYHIIFVPKISNECQSFIKNSEYKKYFNIHNLNIDIYPLDYDLISLEDHASFENIYLHEDYSCISVLKRTILKYETVYGKIKYKYSKGPLAKKLNDIICNEEELLTFENESETLACFIFDRSVDMVTPFCSHFIYEGLLDDYLDINLNSIKVPPQLLEKDSKADFIKIDLSLQDKFYSMIKDYNFNKIRNFLPARLKEHSKILEEGKQKVEDMEKIEENLIKVQQIQEERTSLGNHINLADYISKKQKLPIYKFYLNFEQSLLIGDMPVKLEDFFEDEMGKKADEYNLLRIICLSSIIQGGIRYRIFDQIKKDFLNVYGFQELILWHNLEKINILRTQDNNTYYSEANSQLQIIYEDVDFNEPNDCSYAYGGYCPLIVRLVEKAISQGWGIIKDLLIKIPGDTDFPADESEIINIPNEKQFFLLVFIGGITYGELAAIRYLNKSNKFRKFIIITTNMINSKKIFDALKGKEFVKSNNQ